MDRRGHESPVHAALGEVPFDPGGARGGPQADVHAPVPSVIRPGRLDATRVGAPEGRVAHELVIVHAPQAVLVVDIVSDADGAESEGCGEAHQRDTQVVHAAPGTYPGGRVASTHPPGPGRRPGV